MVRVCRAEIREAFRVLDRDGNGFISKQELGMAMRSLGYMPSEVELAIIMQRLDMDGEDTHTHVHTHTDVKINTPHKGCGITYLFHLFGKVFAMNSSINPACQSRNRLINWRL